MLVTKQIEIDMGHRVPNHKSKCRNLHGHRYKIEVGVDDKLITTEGASDEGMVIDFSDLKEVMMTEIDDIFDHGLCLYREDEFVPVLKESGISTKLLLVDTIPTAENLCILWFNVLKEALLERNIAIKYVKVWETPTSTAIYYGNEK